MSGTITRKRRTREHVIADLSVNHVERQVLLSGSVVERARSDYGYDLFLFTFGADGQVQNGDVRIQVKASDAMQYLRGRRAVSFKIDRADLVSWLGDRVPVLLIVYDAPADRAYWLHVQGHFERRAGFSLFTAGKAVTVHIPTDSVLDQSAMRRTSGMRRCDAEETPDADL